MDDSFEKMQQLSKAFDLAQQKHDLHDIAGIHANSIRTVMQKEMDKVLASYHTLNASAASIALNQSSAIMQDFMARLMQSTADLKFSYQSATDAIYSEIRNLIPKTSMVFEQIAQHETLRRKSMEGILAQVGKMDSLTSSLQKAFMAQDIAQLRMAESLKTYAVFDKSDALAARLMVPQFAFADFVSSTAARLAQITSPMEENALHASLKLAEIQLITTSDALAKAISGASVVAAMPVFKHEAPLVIPIVQQNELLCAGIDFSEDDLDAIVAASPAAQTSELAAEVLLLVTQCNEASMIAGKGDIFKPTNRMLEVFARLPWELATDKNRLASIVDCLFWTLYEGAGDDKLRFLKANGGQLDVSECDVVFRIKHLRNKWLRHDPDHGKESKIIKSWQDVSVALQELGMNGMPVTDADYRMLQRQILKQVVAFLTNLLGCIK